MVGWPCWPLRSVGGVFIALVPAAIPWWTGPAEAHYHVAMEAPKGFRFNPVKQRAAVMFAGLDHRPPPPPSRFHMRAGTKERGPGARDVTTCLAASRFWNL